MMWCGFLLGIVGTIRLRHGVREHRTPSALAIVETQPAFTDFPDAKSSWRKVEIDATPGSNHAIVGRLRRFSEYMGKVPRSLGLRKNKPPKFATRDFLGISSVDRRRDSGHWSSCCWAGMRRGFSLSLGGHPKPAIEGHLKTGQRRNDVRDIDDGERRSSLRRHGQCLERRKETASHSTGAAGMVAAAH